MKQIPLTQGKFALVDDEDYDYLMQWKWYYKISKDKRTGYAKRNEGRPQKTVSMQSYITGVKNSDHIDGNGLNNQKANLREATIAQQNSNKTAYRNNTTGFKGVTYKKSNSKFASVIRHENKSKHLGYFLTAEEAHEAYKKAAIELHRKFAKW
jgi:hypothetical protein